MQIRDFDGKNVCVLGYGKEGRAVVRALETYAPTCEITIADHNADIDVSSNHWKQVGEGWLENLHKFDVIIKSPGIPHLPQFDGLEQKLTNSVQIFFDSIRASGATTIGVTGSKGKSTVSSLIHAILTEAGKKSLLVGNIGEPSIAHIDDVDSDTIVVHELSSYQLLTMTTSPHVAVVTSFFPEHLDYHKSLEAYLNAKAHIALFQSRDDHIFYNAESDGATSIASKSVGHQHPYTNADAPVTIDQTKLIGTHNRTNIAGAFCVCSHLGVDTESAVQAITQFRGLPHRLQDLGVHDGIRWIDDAISTTPEAAIAALNALGPDVRTIILGGQDRGNDFTELGKRIDTSDIEHIILFPESGRRIRTTISKNVSYFDAPDMRSAVEYAKSNTPTGSVCLLSTASPSYNMFKNFEDKGEQFQLCIGR